MVGCRIEIWTTSRINALHSSSSTIMVIATLDVNVKLCARYASLPILQNHVATFFANIERGVIAGAVFSSFSDLGRKLRRCIKASSAYAKLIRWRFSELSTCIRSNEFSATGQHNCMLLDERSE